MSNKPRRVGYIDFDLDNFHADVYLKHMRGELAQRGFDVTACWGMQSEKSRSWAQAKQIPFIDDPQEMDRLVDFYCVLAPSNPEVHLALCQRIFKFRKPTYVDKTFAPSAAVAREIFALADRHGVAMQTTSALRYTAAQQFVREVGGPGTVQHVVAWAPGSSFQEYGVHCVEMVISCMGPGVRRVMRRGRADQVELVIDFTDGRTANAFLYMNKHQMPYAASVTTADTTRYFPLDTSRLFVNMAGAMFDFFETGRPNIDREESLTIRRILDAADDPRGPGVWIDL